MLRFLANLSGESSTSMIFSAAYAQSGELRRQLYRLVQALPPARVAVVMTVLVMEVAAKGVAASQEAPPS